MSGNGTLPSPDNRRYHPSSAKFQRMKTGEGKTLVSTLPAYLNALEGKGVHIVTVNDYLAKRDAEWMGKVMSSLV